jgi:Domain of unknown function DUF29
MSNACDLYDPDFVLWTEEQSALLRSAKSSNLPLDWDNLAEEIESLGRSQRTELKSQIRRILRHLFKLAASPAAEPPGGWHATIRDARVEIEDVLEDSPSLRREIADIVAKQVHGAAKLAAADLERHGERADTVWAIFERSEFTAEEVLGDWFPGRSGRADPRPQNEQGR